jgi:putative RNA 2'-phosphotransferase
MCIAWTASLLVFASAIARAGAVDLGRPKVSNWHVWTSEDGVSHQTRCVLTAFEQQSMGGAAPQWNDRLAASGAVVIVAVQPVDWVGEWHENRKPQWIAPLSGRWYVEAMDGLRLEMGPGEVSLGNDQNSTPDAQGRKGHRSGTLGTEPAVLMIVQLEQEPAPDGLVASSEERRVTNPKLISTSKFLSLILRHKPEEIGLVLDASGWADIEQLVRLANLQGKALTRSIIEEVVATNEKRRFVISEDGSKIRAAQGHSISMDIGLSPRVPPATLFHGTATRFTPSIREHGLRRGSRQHVHLSADETTATSVGGRHGTPVVLRIEAGVMYEQAYTFYLSENGVWLTDHVPPQFIRFPT